MLLFIFPLAAQTDYREDIRNVSASAAVKKSRELANLCVSQINAETLSSSGFDSVVSAQIELENRLKVFENNSRYRPLLGLCFSIYLDELAEMYDLTGDSITSLKLSIKQLHWIEETYNNTVYPITLAIEGNSNSYSEITMSFMFEPVSNAMRSILIKTVKYKDVENASRTAKLILEWGLRANESERREIYAFRYKALMILKAPLYERLDWLRKTMTFYSYEKNSTGAWKYENIDLSIEFYNLLAEWKKSGKFNSQSDLMLAARALEDMGNTEMADNAYQEILTDGGLLNYETTIKIYDYYRSKRQNEKAKQALNRVNVAYLGCVDLSVIALKYSELGDTKKASEFQGLYKKCIRDHKKNEREQKRQNVLGSFSWIPDFWNEKMSVALSINPLVGINTGRVGGIYKYIPMSADLRTGSLLHEFRWNRFIDYNGSDRFTGGNLAKPEIENEITNEWKSLRGNDFSYYLGIIAHRTEDQGYDSRWKGYHAFGVQYLWGNFESDEETALVMFKGNSMAQDVQIRPVIYRSEWLIQWKYSRYYTKWFYYTMFMGAGVGQRNLAYNSPDVGVTESQLSSSSESTFYDQRLVQSNWAGRKLTFRAGIRIGITLK